MGHSNTWEQLYDETEATLIKMAHMGYTVLIKPHPQQPLLEELAQRLRALSGTLWETSVQLLDRKVDVRHLIVNADIVVGFQTTAIFEALIAGKEVIYTFWSKPVHDYVDSLIPFHQYPDILSCATSPEELEQYLHCYQGPVTDTHILAKRHEVFKEYLGIADGQSSKRAWQYIEAYTRRHMSYSSLRSKLDALAPTYCRMEAYRSRLIGRVLQIAALLMPLGYPLWKRLRSILKQEAIRQNKSPTSAPPVVQYQQTLSNRAQVHFDRTQSFLQSVVLNNR
jgi:hypothetical protein